MIFPAGNVVPRIPRSTWRAMVSSFPMPFWTELAILWLLIPGPFALRRFLRLRRGLCPKCAYPMGESPVCSECGKALPKRAVGSLSLPGIP